MYEHKEHVSDVIHPGDLKTRKIIDISCQMDIHFSIQTTHFLMKYSLLCLQTSGRLIITLLNMITKFEQLSFMKEKKRYASLKTGECIFI